MTYIVIDVESDGPAPGKDMFSMIDIGAVVVDGTFDQTFRGQLAPISDIWDPGALAVSGFSREEVLEFPDPAETMTNFCDWVKSFDQPIFWSDNNGYDWMFTNWYLWYFCGENPFGWSSRNLNDLFHGIKGDMRASFKRYRKTKHTHNPVDDAMGNAEALYTIIEKYKVKGSKIEGL